jgi:hypothetical protein
LILPIVAARLIDTLREINSFSSANGYPQSPEGAGNATCRPIVMKGRQRS